MKKKIFKIIGIVVLVFVLLLVAAPFLLKGKIADIIKDKVNHNVDATFNFVDADLSLFSDFPNARVTLDEVSIINKVPFEGDTLFAAKKVALNMSVKELFKSADEPITISTNYDIGKESTEASTEDASGNDFTLALENYEITNSEITYDDYSSGMHLELLKMNHRGTGDLSFW